MLMSVGSESICYWVSRRWHNFICECFQIMFLSPQKLFLFTCLTATAFALPSPSADSTSPYSAKYNSAPLETSRASSSSSFYPAASPLDRTIDLSALGIDLASIFNSLLSPAGIVQQFVLTLTLGKYPIGPFVKTHIVFSCVPDGGLGSGKYWLQLNHWQSSSRTHH